MRGRPFRRFLAVLWLAVPTPADWARAVSPLTTDDADTVVRGRLQLNAGWLFSRANTRFHAVPLNPVIGLSSRGELGATFGYLARDPAAPDEDDRDGVTDLTLSTKWRLWQRSDDELKLSARLDLKLPTASQRRGLGSGNSDASAVLIATRCWSETCLDWNVGYAAIDAPRGVSGDDSWFFSQAVRHDLKERWALIGEAYAAVPSNGASATVFFSGGAQLKIHENLLFSGLIGSATGRSAPHFTGYLGFSCVF